MVRSEQFAPPPKHRIDAVLWWLMPNRWAGMFLSLVLTLLSLVSGVTCVNAALPDERAFVIPMIVAVVYFIDIHLYGMLVHSWRRRVAWQAYWDHVYRDGDIIRSKP